MMYFRVHCLLGLAGMGIGTHAAPVACFVNSEYLQILDESRSPNFAFSNTTRGHIPDLGYEGNLVFISHLSKSDLSGSRLHAWLNFQYDFRATATKGLFRAIDDRAYAEKISQDSLLRIGKNSFYGIGPSAWCQEDNLSSWIARRIFDGTAYTSNTGQKIESNRGAIHGVLHLHQISVVLAPKPGQNFDLLCGSNQTAIACYTFAFAQDSLWIHHTVLSDGWYEQGKLLFSGRASDPLSH